MYWYGDEYEKQNLEKAYHNILYRFLGVLLKEDS